MTTNVRHASIGKHRDKALLPKLLRAEEAKKEEMAAPTAIDEAEEREAGQGCTVHTTIIWVLLTCTVRGRGTRRDRMYACVFVKTLLCGVGRYNRYISRDYVAAPSSPAYRCRG